MSIVFILTAHTSESNAEVSKAAEMFRQRGIRTESLQFPALEISARPHLWGLQAFEKLANAIELVAEPEQLRASSVIVNLTEIDSLDELDPLSTVSNPYGMVIALLVLTFPEINWMFPGLRSVGDRWLDEGHLLRPNVTAAAILDAFDRACVPLFDPTGLRERVRARLRAVAQGSLRPAAYVPPREPLAIAMDEEAGYAFLNSYVVYRSGYRCHAITTYEGALYALRSDVQRFFDRAGDVFDSEGSISLAHYFANLVNHYPDTVKRLCPDNDFVAFLSSPEFMAALARRSNSRVNVEEELLSKAHQRANNCNRASALWSDVASALVEEFGYKVRDDSFDSQNDAAIVLSVEDRFLNFADKDPESNLRLSQDHDRLEMFGALAQVPHRVFITTRHDTLSPPSLTATLKAAAAAVHRKLTKVGLQSQEAIVVHKPCSGILDIWARLEISRPATFIWPPKSDWTKDSEESGHSAPGRLLLVAERLIARAQRILENARAVPDAIHGAVLSLDAKEYLGHRTPTTSLEAVALQHQLEALSECSFYGIEHNIDVKRRFAEIATELNSITNWVTPSKRTLSRLNAELRIVSELVLIFRSHSQFDEEQQSLVKLRRLHRNLWLHRNRQWAWVYWIFWLFRAYVELMLRSLGWLTAAFAFWVLALTILYVISGHSGEPSLVARYWHGFVDTMISFIGLSPPHDMEDLWNGPGVIRVCMLAIGLGFVHLGIFITHLYAIIARR